MTTDGLSTKGLGRRHALTGAAGLGLGLPVLAACGGESEPETAREPTPEAEAGPLTTTGEIPVGGGTIFAEEKVVVTQPTEGDFKAFTATCTHQGCVVGQVEDERIVCGCHGSQFSIADGAVLDGPAGSALGEIEITVEGDQISLA